MGRQSQDATSTAGTGTGSGGRMQRSQSRMSLSASFEALAVYFPCMNSFDEEDGGKRMKMCHADIKCLGLNEHLACQSSGVLQNFW